jgi:Dolichyl-phosphate-mannose-protein mannosyltransferase
MPPPFARRAVLSAAGTVAVVLTLTSARYGYERDELYFRMLRPAWGYVDQPPLVPVVASLLGDHLVALRVPATLCAAGSVVLVALLARELGAAERSQAWAAWAYAGTTAVLDFGHVLLTSTLDLVLWPAVLLLVVRAELRHRPRLWLWAGLGAGLASYNKLLVGLLLVLLAIALAAVGPRDRLRSPYVLGGGLLAAVAALPNVLYQQTHGWPQLAMGSALSENNAGEVRVLMWVFLVVVLGPPLVVVWLAGARHLWHRPELRFLVVAFVLLVAFTFASGAQPHYPTFLLVLLFAAGVAELGERLQRPVWYALVAVNAAVAAVLALPLLPVGILGRTPVPAINLLAADSVGWPTYADQVASVFDALPAADRARAVVVASNYGEAGAVDRFTDLPVYSAHNALYDQERPPDDATTVVFVGGQLDHATKLFGSCEVQGRLDDEVDVDNEEQGQPIAVCRDPRGGWDELWPQLRHLD